MIIMRTVTVGIFHESEIGKVMGESKKENGIVTYRRQEGEVEFVFLQCPERDNARKMHIISTIDAAVISVEDINEELKDTVSMIDKAGITKGVVIARSGTDVKQLVEMTKGTTLESFVVMDKDPGKILHVLSR